ncbi:hypothetical protein NC651_029162 [Populus alba x Populus x berolinensis]|nr:hypothetical protein NC651_029162 [Populus alba x Populus x berolinensis]
MGDSQYSFSLTTFSPTGKLVQIEHALIAVGSGQTSLGIKAANGVVIATEKKLPSILVDESSVNVLYWSGYGLDFDMEYMSPVAVSTEKEEEEEQMAEALLSPILEQLTTDVTQQVLEEVNLVVGVKKQVDKLQSNLVAIQSVLEDADKKQVKDKAVRDWVDKLKDVCYDMDDVLDEWSTTILRWKMEEAEENTRTRQKMRCSFLKSPCSCLNQVVRRRAIALKIKEVCEKVDDIAKEKAMLGFELYRATDEIQRLTTTSFVDESSVIGRDVEKTTVAFHKRSKDECERLTDIGDKIANKCKGLPLAAKVLGGLMQSKITREEWEPNCGS